MNSLSVRLTPDQRREVETAVGPLKTVSEHLGDIVDALKDSGRLLDAVRSASPFLGAVGEAAKESVGIVKFVATVFDKLTAVQDPQTLGAIACTLAYQQATVAALLRVGRELKPRSEANPFRRAIERVGDDTDIDYGAFAFESALGHPFVRAADRELELLCGVLDLSDAEHRRLQGNVHASFVGHLKRLLSDGSTQERFRPWTTLMQLGTAELRAHAALAEHLAYQRYLFREAPVLGVEPYALRDVYVPHDAGELSWEQLKSTMASPFRDETGGRCPLMDTVLDRIGDTDFREAIVVQGTAGAGKSSFSLALCDRLADEGLVPIRLRFRDLDPECPIFDALAAALTYGPGGALPTFGTPPRGEEVLLRGAVFDAHARFRGADICRHVLILDGWDEIQTGSLGLHRQLEKVLADLRSKLIDRRSGIPVRIVITGRPSEALHESRFLKPTTPVLTIRPLMPDGLNSLVANLKVALRMPPLTGARAAWDLADDVAAEVVERYRSSATVEGDRSGALALLGQPLLAMIALRVAAQPGTHVKELLRNDTMLLRRFVDLTCGHAGKVAPVGDDDGAAPGHVAGEQLRTLLQETAAAITMYGRETIPSRELEARLERLGVDLERATGIAENPLSAVLVAFFFHVSHQSLGTEFIHKSFREYLFAECIVRHLLELGDADKAGMPRDAFWCDFGRADRRRLVLDELAPRLGAQWLSADTRSHITGLLQLEAAADSSAPSTDEHKWIRIRDSLADIWEWWVEGVHLRSQPPSRTAKATAEYPAPESSNLASDVLPIAYEVKRRPAPIRTTVVDAHLGDALFHLAAAVHGFAQTPSKGANNHAYQKIIDFGDTGTRLLFFAPFNRIADYAQPIVARINAAGWRPHGLFPSGAVLTGCILVGHALEGACFDGVSAERLVLTRCNFVRTTWTHCSIAIARMMGCQFDHAQLNAAVVVDALFSDCSFRASELQAAVVHGGSFTDCDFVSANCSRVSVFGSRFEGCDFSGCRTDGIDVNKTEVIGCIGAERFVVSDTTTDR